MNLDFQLMENNKKTQIIKKRKENIFNVINPELNNINIIISGGFALSNYLNKTIYNWNDLDCYFTDYESFLKTKIILDDFQQKIEVIETDNAITYVFMSRYLYDCASKIYKTEYLQELLTNKQKIKIQLIKNFKNPASIIQAHDMHNLQICYYNNKILFNNKINYLFETNLLSLNLESLYEKLDKRLSFDLVHKLYERILKYNMRYHLKLNAESIEFLIELKSKFPDFFKEIITNFATDSSGTVLNESEYDSFNSLERLHNYILDYSQRN